MYIVTAKEILAIPPMSPFPRRVTPFSENITGAGPQIIGPGLSIPDLIRKEHGTIPITPVRANFPFLSRDNKIKTYEPGVEDKFVFKDFGSVARFSSQATQLHSDLVEIASSLDCPTKKDEKRGWMVLDTNAMWQLIDAAPENVQYDLLRCFSFVASNEDIIKKASIIRTVQAGWWTASYRGRESKDRSAFKLSISAHIKAFEILSRTSRFQSEMVKLWDEGGDPVYTNSGYPFYAADKDKEGRPLTKLRSVELLKNAVPKSKMNFTSMLDIVNATSSLTGIYNRPWAASSIRRSQATGSKTLNCFDVTNHGMVSRFTVNSFNSIRVAFAVPYTYNINISPFFCLLKAYRKLLPGCYHDGDSRQRRLNRLRAHSRGAGGRLWLAESDYSNYDRSIPIDIVEELLSAFANRMVNGLYYKDAAMFLHKGISIIWPDYHSDERGIGHAFAPPSLGLLSGVKSTSEIGTIINSVIVGQSLADAYGWSEDQLVRYLTMYASAEPGSGPEKALMLGDDLLFVADTYKELRTVTKSFVETAPKAGVDAELIPGNRFLMRHMSDGEDTPVPMRVRQNSLSNEAPPASELIMLAGLASRTDGLFGVTSTDPFLRGTLVRITKVEAFVSQQVIKDLESFFSSSAHVSPTAVKLLQLLSKATPPLTLAAVKSDPFGFVSPDSSVANELHRLRKGIVAMLAQEELSKLAGSSVDTSWIYELHRDAHSPTSALLLQSISSLSPSVTSALSKMAGVENSLFKHSTATMGVPPPKLK